MKCGIRPRPSKRPPGRARAPRLGLGIDADLFFPDARSRHALKVFLDGLGQSCGALFGAGEYVSYSNGGMIVAGNRIGPVLCGGMKRRRRR
jgi:hypothetical protein